MSRSFTTLAALLMTLGLVLSLAPATFAQSVGDEEYKDPFGEVKDKPPPPQAPDPNPPSSPPSGGGSTPSGTATSSLPDTATDPSATSTGATSATTTTPAGAEELARTGLPAGLLASLGLAMLLSGLSLRMALARQAGRT